MNKLYYGDCLTIMQQEMKLNSVDLIYLDPPFNSNRDYNAIYKDETGRPLPDQIEAFCDLWELDEERERAIRQMPILMRDTGIDDDVAEFWKIWCNALRKTQPRLLAYLSYMVQRLLPMRGLLRPAGSIYLHCDPTASHYIKIMMDGIFGHKNFRNEIIWQRGTASGGKAGGRKSVPNHDVLLHYVVSLEHFTYHRQYIPYTEKYIKQRFVHVDGDGRHYRKQLRGRKQYLDNSKGKPITDIWTDVYPVNPNAKERLGYATQKPLTLLERIIKASSNPGDVVFDPFCGCATTIEAAHKLGRDWMGIDIAIHAIKRVAKIRLEDRLGLVEDVHFEIEGVPRTVEGARDLWERDKYHFQKWVIEQIDGFVTSRKTADGGIDGRLYFDIPNEKNLQSMVLEVKGGKNVNIGIVRDLRGVLERDEALMAGLIVMGDLGATKTRNFAREMAAAGDLDVLGTKYPRMQLLTVSEILDNKRFSTPSVARGRGEIQPSLKFS